MEPGANYGGRFQPQPTSYDYDAPIDELGRPTSKFFALREILARHLAPGETLPDVPQVPPLIEIPKIEFTRFASVFDILGRPVRSERPLCFEDLDQGFGYVLYRTKLTGPVEATLKIKELRDFAVVCVDHRRVGVLDRRYNKDSLPLKITGSSATLDVLVENGGRINYGGELPNNRKGITKSVMLGDRELSGWEMFKLPFDSVPSIRRVALATNIGAPFIARGTFELPRAADALLDLGGWDKGIVLINGHNLGRYWHIGPQQTLYVPGVWLKPGRNECVIFEQLRDGVGNLAGTSTPVLDQLNPDENAPAPRPRREAPKLSSATAVAVGQLNPGSAAQNITFAAVRCRYVCLQALSSQNSDEYTTLAELDALDSAGNPLLRQGWKVLYADSEENLAEDAGAEKAIDGERDSFWHTLWSAPHPSHPHTLLIDLGSEHELTGIRLLPRQDSANGRIKDYRLYLSLEPF